MTSGTLQGRRRGKRKTTATIIMDDPEHILLDRKVTCSTLTVHAGPALVLAAVRTGWNPTGAL